MTLTGRDRHGCGLFTGERPKRPQTIVPNGLIVSVCHWDVKVSSAPELNSVQPPRYTLSECNCDVFRAARRLRLCVCVGLNWELSASGWTAPPLQFLYISLASSGQSRAEQGRAGTMTDRAIDKPRSSERKSWCQLSLSLCESSLHSEQIRAQSK